MKEDSKAWLKDGEGDEKMGWKTSIAPHLQAMLSCNKILPLNDSLQRP